MSTTLQLRRDTFANLASLSPALTNSELVRLTDDDAWYYNNGSGNVRLRRIPVNAQVGTSYTYLRTDNRKVVTHTNASAIAGTLPQAGTSGFEDGWSTAVYNRGAGTLTITPTTSTINGAATLVLQTDGWAFIYSDGTNYIALINGGGSGTVDTSGTPADDQIAVFTDADTIEGDSNLTYDGSTLTVKNTTDSASVQVLQIHGDRATPADDDAAYASLCLSNDAGTQIEMGRLTWIADDISAGSESSTLRISTLDLFGSLTTIAEISTTGFQFLGAPLRCTRSNVTAFLTNDSDSASVEVVRFSGNRATPTDADEAYWSCYLADDGVGSSPEVARFTWVADDVTDGTVASHVEFDVRIADTLTHVLNLYGTHLSPASDDGLALGQPTTSFSDLFLASGAVINFANGDVVLTHSSGVLTVSAGALALGTPASGDLSNCTGYKFPKNHIAGLITSNNGTDADHDIDIAAGECRDADDTENLVLSSPLTKRSDAFWSVGSGNGGRGLDLRTASYQWTASGSGTSEYYLEKSGGGAAVSAEPDRLWENGTSLFTPGTAGSLSAGEWDWADNDSLGFSTIYVRLSDSTDPDSKGSGYVATEDGVALPDTVYAVWLIKRTDSNVVDAFIGTNFTTPCVPVEYDKKRLIGAVKTDASSNIYPYYQLGDWIYYVESIREVQDSTIVSGTFETLTVSVPPNCLALLTCFASNPNQNTIAMYLRHTDSAEAISTGNLVFNNGVTGGMDSAGGQGMVAVDGSSQMEYAALEGSGTTTAYVETNGFYFKTRRDP